MSFPKYPEYKDSGVEWLGKVPAHWFIAPLRWYATIQGGVAKGKSYSDDTPTVDLPYLRVANVQDGHVDLSSVNTVTVAVSEVGRYRLRPGDVLMNEGGDNDKLGRGAVWEDEIADCLHQNHVFAIRPNQNLLPYWLSMFTRSSAARSYFYLYSKQSTNLASISSSNVMSCPLPLPPAEEQRQVLSFLDHETARIDALVEEQQRLIELLKEKRQAVISHAVTKGLDPEVPMKDSGVEWLGEVPAHWEVMKFVRCVDIAEGQVDPKLERYRGKILIAPNHIESFSGRILYLGSAEEQGAESGKYVCQSGDVVYSKIRPALRKACILDQSALCSADMYPLRPFGGLTSEFLLWSILSEPFSRLAVLESERVAMPKINRESLNEIYMAIPPIHEQEEIDRYISEETHRLDKLTSTAEDSVGLLAERRSALISATVTGKIDVRGWKADQQPEQSEVLKAAEARATYG